MSKTFRLVTLLLILQYSLYAQTYTLGGQVVTAGSKEPIPFALLQVLPAGMSVQTDSSGIFQLEVNDSVKDLLVVVDAPGYQSDSFRLSNSNNQVLTLRPRAAEQMEEVVVTGTMRAVSRLASPIPVEVYSPRFFRKNPTPSLFDAVGMINGVRPQLNCNVCNTGDIHINGMEGAYTLILIDGMPIVSALSTVYGLSGIPNSIVERLEVVKGPAASLYGSEAMGGIINVITKPAGSEPSLRADMMTTSWMEHNMDLSLNLQPAKGVQTLIGLNYFNYNKPYDKNGDGFTDITLQDRVAVFNKWSFARKLQRSASIGLRYVYEDRWGGQMKWTSAWRGSDSIYGESIYTGRWELIAQYQLPLHEKIMTQFSLINHDQNSYYGTTSYQANQKVAFAQMYWEKALGRHSLLSGLTYRYTYYDDNTAGTANEQGENQPAHTPLPGIFVQDEWTFAKHHTLLLGYRFDYDRHHGAVHSPRLAYKWSPNRTHTLRGSFGTGFRVVNLFTEDHAALTGSRKVEIAAALKPERSYNANLNYVLQVPVQQHFANIDLTAFYGYFTNKITADYLSDPDKIIYDNLHGHAVTRGLSVNGSMNFTFPLSLLLGVTYMDVYQMEDVNNPGQFERRQQLFAPRWSGNFAISYQLPRRFSFDFTGQVNGPMKLPLQEHDYRPEYSPLFCLANIQITKKIGQKTELYGGLKNLFNFIPENTFMRPFDPFDKYTNSNNPNGYTFDTEYNYAPIQGIKGFAGLRYRFL